jgi:TolB-like protein/class 3 adenylate cyclase
VPLPPERRLAAILSADVVGYSRLMAEAEGETVRTLSRYRDEVGILVPDHRGRVVDFTGDNFLAEFPAALDAVRAAVEIQRVVRALNADLPAERRMEFRIGVHLGDIRVEGERIYGDGVNIAARLQALAEPGGICISAEVQRQVHHKLQLGYDDLGEQSVKNVPDPVHVYRVRLETETALLDTSPRPLRKGALAAALLLLVGLAAWAGWRMLGSRMAGPAAAISSPIRSLAVLPLQNISGDPEQQYFADGMTEALISDLGRVGSLRVISRTSAMQYQGVHRPLPEIARELNVDAIIEGTVLRVGNEVRITAQLIDARSDHHLWSESYQRDFQDLLALQGEVAHAITEKIELELTPQEQARLRQTKRVDPKAYEAYLRGLQVFDRRTPASHTTAAEYFEEAARAAPDFAAPYAALADTFT